MRMEKAGQIAEGLSVAEFLDNVEGHDEPAAAAPSAGAPTEPTPPAAPAAAEERRRREDSRDRAPPGAPTPTRRSAWSSSRPSRRRPCS